MDALAIEEDVEDDSARRAARAHGVDAIEVPPNVGGWAPRHACAVAGDHAQVPARLHARVAASASAQPSRAADRIADALVQWRGRGRGGGGGDVGRGFDRRAPVARLIQYVEKISDREKFEKRSAHRLITN
jgi:hypothetical protein